MVASNSLGLYAGECERFLVLRFLVEGEGGGVCGEGNGAVEGSFSLSLFDSGSGLSGGM
jgi:hypothetical protein